MILGRAVGTVTSTVKHSAYDGLRLLMIEQLDENLKGSGHEFIAVDNAQAGVGDVVLVLREGTGVREIFDASERAFPVLETVVAIVDEVRVGV